MSDLEKMQRDVREWTIRKGWRENDAVPDRTMGEELALLNTEVAEATEAYRLHGMKRWYVFKNGLNDGMITHFLADGVVDYNIHKPEGVASELVDTLIRLLDNYAEHGLIANEDCIHEIVRSDTTEQCFGDNMSALHAVISGLHIYWYWKDARFREDASGIVKANYDNILSFLYHVMDIYEVDVNREFAAKMAYNEGRSNRHGGKKL